MSSSPFPAVKRIIKQYEMDPHPEGGYYKETYRADIMVETDVGERSASTAIKFLVTAGELIC